nr:hypothetical protein [Aminobacter aminovorans]
MDHQEAPAGAVRPAFRAPRSRPTALALEDLDADIARIRESRPSTHPPLERPSHRKPLPDHLPREDVRLDIEEPYCVCCGGAPPCDRRERQRDARLPAQLREVRITPQIRLPSLRDDSASGCG